MSPVIFLSLPEAIAEPISRIASQLDRDGLVVGSLDVATGRRRILVRKQERLFRVDLRRVILY